MDYEFLHAAFPDRIDAGRSWQRLTSGSEMGKQALKKLQVKGKHPDNGKGKDADQLVGAGAQIDNSDLSRISDFTQDLKSSHPQGPLEILPAPPLNISTSAKCNGSGNAEATTSTDRRPADDKKDPLAEFYPQAKAERDAAWRYEDSDIEDDCDEIFPPVENVRVKKGFTCDKKEVQRTECANQDIIHKLQELMELHKSKASDDDHWRVIGYAKCIRALRNYPRRIKSLNEARAIRGVGEKTALKIMEIIKTGDLRRIEYERTEDIEATTIFQGIYGVGRQIALMWYANGCRTLDDIKARKGGIKVSSVQDIGIQFYDDINARMPRAEAQQIFTLVKQQALALDPRLFIEIMGSFRRGKADCGDIDILLTRPVDDGKTHSGLLLNLLSSLHAADILTEDLSLPDDFSSLELSYRGLCHLPEEGSRRRRIDILCVPWERRGAALLYFTGDDIFNRAIRLKANVLGYSLNQRGLYHGVVRDPRDRRIKVCEGTIIASETEEEIFKILGVPWQEPHERVRG
ncbi:hypothetical protein SERLADRAFT_452929 [Serpula lacrymans var. lacrymans S7.9]|uniref:DNA polymerase n=1 Tax=Serpula lacrymans var. lacrymans (strain S7.9) TaxID=578457 RepID=F8P995_SERL9|nr:uncharacterized protein SERLADRAFT_452929 [Serpula lacrymans var. lacrymans S7.9]EGO20224.1 hypothetical protein SERLADRAFT_452929 [Serpula lacrymans var. lacrymans S7.9]